MATIRIKISDDKIKTLLGEAFESGGSDGWCRIKSFNYPKGQTQESLHIEYPHLDLPLIEGGSLTLENIEDPDIPKYQPDTRPQGVPQGACLLWQRSIPTHSPIF